MRLNTFGRKTLLRPFLIFSNIVNMVDSMVIVVVKSTAGWLLQKGRGLAAEHLRNGDVFDQKLCRLIESDLDNIKNELQGQRRQHLVASISAFKQGLTSISFDRSDGPAAKRRKTDPSSSTRNRFKQARENADLAVAHSALWSNIKDGISATYIQVMATLLEEENPTRAIGFCMNYLEHLHSRESVIKNFETELSDSPFKTREGTDIAWSVCYLNHIVFDMVQVVGGDWVSQNHFIWPHIEIGSGRKFCKVDPLRDPRLYERFNKRKGKEYCSVVREFGQEFTKSPSGIATNAQGQFIVADQTETKMVDNSGKYLKPLSIVTAGYIQYHAVDVDTDKDDNIYLLVQMISKQNNESWYEVFVFDKDCKQHYSFQLRNKYKGCKVAVNQHEFKTEVLVLKKVFGDLHAKVEVYETGEGTFVAHFGGNILMDAHDLVCDGNGHTFVLDKCHCGSQKKYIRVFGARRYQLHCFEVGYDSAAVAFHRASRHIVIASINKGTDLILSLYNSDGEEEHIYKHVNDNAIVSIPSITVTTKGRIVVALIQQSGDLGDEHQGKVVVY